MFLSLLSKAVDRGDRSAGKWPKSDYFSDEFNEAKMISWNRDWHKHFIWFE